MSMPDGVLRVAMTGGIATGKSYVRQRLQEADVPTIDADVLAREALAPGTAGFRAVLQRFGRGVLSEGGAIDRSRLASIVFTDPPARGDLEAIVHPEVYARIGAWFTRLRTNGYLGPAVADVPLLFETGHADDFDMVVVVACDEATQLARLMRRDGLAEDAARQRLAAQWPIASKVDKADVVIRTDGTFAQTDAQAAQLADQLRRQAGA
jgi:dephospho-CoA kinase